MRDQAGKEMEGAFQAQCAKAAGGPEGWGDWQQMKLGGPDTDQKTVPRGTGFGSRKAGSSRTKRACVEMWAVPRLAVLRGVGETFSASVSLL